MRAGSIGVPLGVGIEWSNDTLIVPTVGITFSGVVGAPVRSILPLRYFDASAIVGKTGKLGDRTMLHVRTQPVMLEAGAAREAA